MKPRMEFYSDGKRVDKGNMIIPYSLLTYVMQLNRLELDGETVRQGFSIKQSEPYISNPLR